MRTIKSIKNAIIAIITNVITMLVGLISQAIFIKILGQEYLGINSLFSNIIYMLSIVELGIGTAIIYNLYKPVSENDIEEINALLYFYKKAYRLIAFIVLSIGICIIPFLNQIVGNVNIGKNIYVIFILFLLDSVLSYLLTYKRSILYATQNAYIVNIIYIFYIVFMNLVASLVLILTKNYYIYLVVKIVFRILNNVVTNIVAQKKYPYIKIKNIKKLPDTKIKEIVKKIKALFFHKIGEVMILGTDSIIISKFLGIIWVGLYSNYNMIINAISGLFGQVFSAVTASVGNLLVEENTEKIYRTYRKMILLNFWTSSFCSISIFCLMKPFITLWIGKEYLLPTSVLFMITMVFYMQTMKKTLKVFKEGAGKFEQDKYIPILESIINIVFSIIFVKYFGLIGVFIGTFISTLILYFYSYPKLVYKGIFNKSYKIYIKEYVIYAIIMIIVMSVTYICTEIITIDNQLIQLMINGIICICIPNIIYYLLYKNTEEFNFYKTIIINKIKKLEVGGKNEKSNVSFWNKTRSDKNVSISKRVKNKKKH